MTVNVYADLQILGLKVRDRVTGFTGVATSICFDLYGCTQVIITPPANEKGELVDGLWFDLHRLEVNASVERVMSLPAFALPAEPERFVGVAGVKGPADKPIPERITK